MRVLLGLIFMLVSLSACQTLGVPGSQTLGISADPEQAVKMTIVATSLVTDAVAVVGKLPPCDKTVSQPLGCRPEKAYRDAKLILQSTVDGFSGIQGSNGLSSLVMVAALGYAQYEISKTLANESGPTNPQGAPTPQTVAYLAAIGAADVLINSADQRVRDASGPNTTVPELLAELQAKVSALP